MPGFRLDGKVAVVTGGAQGLGGAICLALARAGAGIALNARPGGSSPAEIVEAITAAAGRCEVVEADVADSAQAEHLMKETQARFGRLDIVVNNAGISRDSLLLGMPDDAWQQVMATNVGGTFHCIRAAAPYLIEQRAGAIVNISSVVADTGNLGASNYAASKGAINSLTRSAALEFARFGVRVNAVAPGVVETRIMARVLGRHRDRLLQRIPLGRFANPEEVANAVVFLASDEASYITGEVIRVSGGMGLAQ